MKGTQCTFRSYSDGCLQLVAQGGHCTNEHGDKTHHRRLLLPLDKGVANKQFIERGGDVVPALLLSFSTEAL